ncbi:MAG: hypothetical protein HUJ76_12400 [Parasporobacterium sp.]|nr:hypothetical protein [Parasporobacterium sp.]
MKKKLLAFVLTLAMAATIFATVTFAAAPAQPKLIPAGMRTDGSVEVNWYTVAGADGYNIYRKTNSDDWECIGYVGSMSTPGASGVYIDSTVQSGNSYTYSVSSVSDDGEESSYSTAGNTIECVGKAAVTVKNGVAGIKLEWPAVAGATGYKIYRRPAGTHDIPTEAGDTTSTSFVDKKVTACSAFE